MEYTKRQLKELLTTYGAIDYFFFDGPAEQLTDYAWDMQPNFVITRGVMETPERYIPGVPLEGAWEGNLTMGTAWPWKAMNEVYKSGTELIETRAKRGNLLLNIGPKPDGDIAIEQEVRLREIASDSRAGSGPIESCPRFESTGGEWTPLLPSLPAATRARAYLLVMKNRS